MISTCAILKYKVMKRIFIDIFSSILVLSAAYPCVVYASTDSGEYDYDGGVLTFNDRVVYPFIAQPGPGAYSVKLEIAFHFDVFMCNDFENGVRIINLDTKAEETCKVDETCTRLPAGSYLFRVDYCNPLSSERNYELDMIITETADSEDLPPTGGAESRSNHNYIVSKIFTDKSGTISRNEVEYFDGLGFPVQKVQAEASPSGKDLIVLTEYDSYGRPIHEWLPAVLRNGGEFTRVDKVKASSVYINGDTEPFSVTEYEASPLQRAVKNISPGEVWHSRDKCTRTEYFINRTETYIEQDIEPDLDLGTLDQSDMLSHNFTVSANSGPSVYYVKINVAFPSDFFLSCSNIEDDISVKNLETGTESIVKNDYGNVPFPAGTYLIGFGYNNTTAASMNIDLSIYIIYRENDGTPPPSPVTKVTNFLWCNHYKGTTNGDIGVSTTGLYEAGQLRVTKVTGADGQVSYTFTDAKEQTVLVRAINGESYHDTYYIYDDRGNLSYVLPPMIGDDVSVENLNRFAYIYRYDARDRCIQKKLPGMEWVYYVYDKADRVIFTQTGEQRIRNEWTFSIPDIFGRQVLSGVCKNSLLVGNEIATAVTASLKTTIASQYKGYIISGVTLHAPTSLSANYYDNYDFKAQTPELSFESDSLFDDRFGTDGDNMKAKGLLTGTLKAVVDNDGSRYTLSAIYYDRNGRVIQTVEKNHLGGISRSDTKYDFVGNILAARESHGIPGNATVDIKYTTFTYDHQGRMLSETVTLNGSDPAAVRYAYDELGRLVGKTYGTGGNAVTEICDYNIQGWLAEKRSSYFDLKLRYIDPRKAETQASYTGNIMECDWAHIGTDADNSLNTYTFAYDGLSRLTGSKRYIDDIASDQFVERGLSYDKNGNIQTLQRVADGTLADDLAYRYSGNHLTAISGTTSGTYTYDANGNMIHDGANNLALFYNHLNLIEKAEQDGATLVKYSYLSDNTKLAALDAGANGLYYLGSLVYESCNGVLSLESAAFSSGRIFAAATAGGISYSPQYHLTDHLGSVRVIVDNAGEVVERNDYYPFGLRWDEGLLSGNRYRYNGKEEQSFIGLPYTDYGARMYEPRFRLGWNGSDLLAEKYYPISPYVFCLNNPMKYLDPNGMEIDISGLSEDQLKAFELMLLTPEGLQFVGRYMSKGATLQVGDKTYKFNEEGDRSKDKLWIRSSEMEGRLGHNEVYTKVGFQKLNDDKFGLYNKQSNIIDGVHQVIDLKNSLSVEQAANTLGHEAFVHADKDADALNSMDKKIKNGYYGTYPDSYRSDARRIATSGLEDHQTLGRGEVVKYKKYSQSLVNVTGNRKFLELYNKDVNRY